jgi:hypothetical protein
MEVQPHLWEYTGLRPYNGKHGCPPRKRSARPNSERNICRKSKGTFNTVFPARRRAAGCLSTWHRRSGKVGFIVSLR